MFRRRIKAQKVTSIEEIDSLAATGTPVLVDFMQLGCAPCKVMDGIVDELAEEFADSAHVVKVDLSRVPEAVDAYRLKSTPTLVLLAVSAKARKKTSGGSPPKATQRWRASGLVKKDDLRRVLISNGATGTD